MRARALGRIVGWEGASLWVLRAPEGTSYPRTDFHAHHVIQVSLALSGEVHFDGDAGHVSGFAVAVAPDARHAFRGTGLVAHLFIAPDGQAGRELVRGLFASGAIVHVPRGLAGDLPARLERAFARSGPRDEELRALGRELVARLAGVRVRSEPVDRRVTKMIAWATGRLEQSVSLREAASIAGLSEGRTRHLFVEHTGLSFRTYVLWLRLAKAVEMFSVGASLTEAAHGAGFADSAHLSRTFRRMFGIAAVSLSLAD